jgi:hypothetical protein
VTGHALDGRWVARHIGITGATPFALRLQTGPNQTLTGTYDSSQCNGMYNGNGFALLCRRPGASQAYLVTGAARETPPVATTRARPPSGAKQRARIPSAALTAQSMRIEGREQFFTIGQSADTVSSIQFQATPSPRQ